VEIEFLIRWWSARDLGILRLADEAWPSDNTDPFDRLSIRMASPRLRPGVMVAWVTDSPNWMNGRSTSLEFRFLSSMQGKPQASAQT